MNSGPPTPAGMEPTFALQVCDVSKRFGATTALDHAGLQLRRGERLALLGPNGAGKSTLVGCICGRSVPDSGAIEMLGRPLPASGGRHQLGFVPQEIALYPDLTARENLDAFGRFHGLTGGDLRQAVDWALQWTGLADRARDLTKTFSSGMKRRVNIACGVLHRPLLLLLDEPTVGVDPQSRDRIFGMLDELWSQGTSILLTTHQLEEAEQQCDRIVIIDAGHVIAEGTLAELIAGTIGTKRRVVFTLAGACPEPTGCTTGDKPHELVAEVDDVALELPGLLTRIRESGGQVADLDVHPPSLHSVFIHLTGRELRE
ncbi:MAG: ABC transporter ATP-binding protein [Thermoanaerobaculales bacterium]|nr:ABC transporter ATP-binding protein [Thermoanaerobaculales bacterium]